MTDILEWTACLFFLSVGRNLEDLTETSFTNAKTRGRATT